jgi:hypothetical protein
MTIPEVVASIIANFLSGLGGYLPQFVAGLILLAIGLLVANALKKLTLGLFELVKVETWFKKTKALEPVDARVWLALVGELLRWSVLILFLVAAVETWGIGRVGDTLNELLLYLPNVFVAAVIGFVGVVVGNLVADIVRHSAKGLGSTAAGSLATLAHYAVVVFTVLLVLHQLGVAADLIRILFTGIVAMMALAGGLAFGLGGQETARKVLDALFEKLRK